MAHRDPGFVLAAYLRPMLLPMPLRFLVRFVISLGLCLTMHVQACQMLSLSAPARFDTLADRRPTLRWSGEVAQVYRVQLAAVLPEARVVMVLDTDVTGNSFRLPSPLPVERAAVKVLVSTGCPKLDAQDLQAQGAWFFVDVRQACAVDGRSLAPTPVGLSWDRVVGAQAYAVRLFESGAEDREALVLLHQENVASNAWTLPDVLRARFAGARLKAAAQRVATVQAVCDGLPGRPQAVVFDAGRP